MKALTVRQPWAWAIAHGRKRIENRIRSTKHRGPLAIHAGMAGAREGWTDLRVRTAFEPFLYGYEHEYGIDPAIHQDQFLFGAVIAVVDVLGCHVATGDCCTPWGDRKTKTCRNGQFIDVPVHHWRLGNARLLPEPIPATGRLGLWDCDVPDPSGVSQEGGNP